MMNQSVSNVFRKYKVKLSFDVNTILSPSDNVYNIREWDVRSGAKVYVGSDVKMSDDARIIATGRGTTVVIADGTDIGNSTISVKGRDCFVIIGRNCVFKRANIIVGDRNSSFVCGKEVTWESGACLAKGTDSTIVIGDDCMLSNGILIRTDDGHGIFDRETKNRINNNRDVIIDAHVWIGNGARVNKGAFINSGAVLGGGSIASGDLDGHCIYAGIPARKIKENVSWSRTFSWDDIPEDFR